MLRKAALVFMSAIFVVFIFMIASRHVRVDFSSPVAIPENHLVIEGLYLIHVTHSGRGYAALRAESAYADATSSLFTLSRAEMDLQDDKNFITTQADKGVYIMNETLTATGNVMGEWNEMTYTVAPEGSFRYDFTSGTAVAGDNVSLITRNSHINARELNYDAATQAVSFTGGVNMLIGEEAL